MKYFSYKKNLLHAENCDLRHIAQQHDTPCYIYSKTQLTDNWNEFKQALGTINHQICYAVKANSNLSLLHLLATEGAGFDIVSGGELERVLVAKGDPKKIVFSGVGKSPSEIRRALEVGIGCFNVESEDELHCLESISQEYNKPIPISLRVNPDVSAETHPYISTGFNQNKFGIPIDRIIPLATKLFQSPHLHLIGLATHIGSQLTELSATILAVTKLIQLAKSIKEIGHILQHLNVGGGLGVQYNKENPPSITDYITTLKTVINDLPYKIIIEPGRSLVANIGILLTKIEYIKKTPHKNFVIVDAGMNDLLRPALYHAWHNIIPVQLTNQPLSTYDIVGPVCESGDFLGKDRQLSVKTHDLLAICTVGAYGFSMSSNYNSRPRPAEILIDNNHIKLIRARESVLDLFHYESQFI